MTRVGRRTDVIRYLALLVVVVAMALAGCSKLPEETVTTAETAMATAKQAEADKYAPDMMQMAQDTLNAAMAAKAEQDAKMGIMRSYGETKRLLEKSAELGAQAQEAAAMKKEQVRNEVSAMLAEARMALDSCGAALAKAKPGKDNKAELELMKNELAGLNTSYAEAQAKFDSGAYLESQLQLSAVVEKARNMSAQLAAASSRAGTAKR